MLEAIATELSRALMFVGLVLLWLVLLGWLGHLLNDAAKKRGGRK